METLAYFKIGENDYSAYVSGLKVNENIHYNAQTNAAGNTVVDYINRKRTIEVNIIPLTDAQMLKLQLDIAAFGVSISFRNPKTNALEENISCIIPANSVEYYTIQANKVMYNAATLTFTEL